MSTYPYMRAPWQIGQTPEETDPVSQMAAPAQMAAPRVNPHETLTVPLSASPVAPAQMSAKAPSPLDQQETTMQGKLSDLQAKDKAQPHGFWGHLGHGLNVARNIAETAILPGVAMADPTSTLHRQVEEQGLTKGIQGIEKQKSEQALQEQQAAEASARTKNIPVETQERASEQGMKIDANGNLVPQTPEEYSPKLKSEQELQQAQIYGLKNPWAKMPDKEPLQNIDDINAGMNDRYQVLHPGQKLPAHFKLQPNATKGDFERVDKLLNGEEAALGSQQQRELANQMRAQTYALALQNSQLAQQNRENKSDTSVRQAAYKAFQPALDSGERFNVMTKNYEDAVKNHDQQAMLSLLANHLGMTMGLQKGARLTKDIIREAQQSRPWLQGLAAKFDKDGYLQGVTLTPEQMRQMVDLGRGRFNEDTVKARSEARYMGANDDGPDRIPSKATINFYLGQSGGDATKAKQMATEDGWTVK